jgi:hypothetical protein
MQQLIPPILAALAALATAAEADQPAPAAPRSPPPARWGTANAANLKAMARPEDLAAPAATSPGNGHLDAAAVQRLMDGKVTDLIREGSTGGAAGGGAGAPQ